MKNFLSADEENILRIWMKSENQRLAKRAQILKLLSMDIPTKDIAKQFAVNEQRVYALGDRFAAEGVLGLLDEPRVGRPTKISEKGSNIILNLLEQSDVSPKLLNKIAEELDVSIDTLWRRGRLADKYFIRSIVREIPVNVDPLGATGLVSLLVSQSVLISVTRVGINPLIDLKSSGVWDRSLIHDFAVPRGMNLLMALDFAAMAKYKRLNFSFRKNRQLKECYQRWLQANGAFSNKKGQSLLIHVAGDFSSDNMLYCLQSLKLSMQKVGGQQPTVTFFPNALKWISNLIPSEPDYLLTRQLVKKINAIRKHSESVFAWTR